MDLQALKNEIEQDPLALGYAQFLPGTTGMIEQIMNEKRDTILMVKEKLLNDVGLASIVVPVHGIDAMDSIFTKFDTAAHTSPTFKRMLERLYSTGLDFGDAGLMSIFESWRGVHLTQQEVDILLEIPLSRESRSVQLFGESVRELDIINAINLEQ